MLKSQWGNYIAIIILLIFSYYLLYKFECKSKDNIKYNDLRFYKL